MAFTKIGFYGDSFVEVWQDGIDGPKNDLKTWPRIVADKFDLEIVHTGKGGTSYWDIPLQQFTLKPNAEGIIDIPDILIFCWTSSNRLYSKDRIQLMPNPRQSLFQLGPKTLDPLTIEKMDSAARGYYKYIHDEKKEIAEYQACLYWFDETILSKIPSDRKIIHLWSYGHENTENPKHRVGTYHPENLKYLHTWKNGCEIRPSCMSISLMDGCNVSHISNVENHFNTQDKHNIMADFIMHSLIDTNIDGGYDRGALNDYSENITKRSFNKIPHRK